MLINDSLQRVAMQLGLQLAQRNARLVSAESCTGGAIAAAITAVAGSSAWFECGLVAYSNGIKQKILAVPASILETYGAVSEPVVRAMAEGALKLSGADYALAVSGIAGPAGGSACKPVGTVCIAWGCTQNLVSTCEYFDGGRDAVREQAVAYAIGALGRMLSQAVDGC